VESKLAAGAAPIGTSLPREVWRLAWPAMTQMLLLTTVFLVSRAMIGRHSSAALASMQISGPLTWSVVAVLTAFSAGTIAVVGRAIGAGDLPGAAAAARASLGLGLGVGIAVAIPLTLATGPIAHALFPNASAAVHSEAAAYIGILAPVLPVVIAALVAAASLQAAGDTRSPLAAAVVGNAVNVVLSALLIFGLGGFPRLGIRGAAIGTAIAFVLEAVILLFVLMSPRSPMPCWAKPCGADRDALGRVIRVSWPAFGEKLLYHAGFMGFVAIIGLLGPVAMASNQALVSIESICFLSAEGFGIASGAIMAQKLGAGRPDDAGRAGLLASGMCILLLTACGLLFAAIPRVLVAAFTSDPEIVATGARALYVAAVAQPFMAFATVMGMGLRGAGDTRTVLAVTLLCAVGVRLAATWTFAVTFDLGLVGVWMGSTTDWICRSALLWLAFSRGRWRTVRV